MTLTFLWILLFHLAAGNYHFPFTAPLALGDGLLTEMYRVILSAPFKYLQLIRMKGVIGFPVRIASLCSYFDTGFVLSKRRQKTGCMIDPR